jgi:hypothetical protein
MMQSPGPDSPAVERLEYMLWRALGHRSELVGPIRFRRLVRLTVRHWPIDGLGRILRSGHWNGVERKRAGRILVARVRESYELSDGITDAWPILLEGTVGLLWSAICDLYLRDEAFRASLPDLSRWIARNGLE